MNITENMNRLNNNIKNLRKSIKCKIKAYDIELKCKENIIHSIREKLCNYKDINQNINVSFNYDVNYAEIELKYIAHKYLNIVTFYSKGSPKILFNPIEYDEVKSVLDEIRFLDKWTKDKIFDEMYKI